MPKTATLKSKPVRRPAPAAKTRILAPVPEGMAWVSAYITVKSPETAIPFYEKAFGFTKKLALPGENGKIQHAELQYQDSTILLGPECSKKQNYAPATIKGTPFTFYVYTKDVDALTAQARKAGATITQEPNDAFWGDRVSLVVDPEGYRWMFATRVREFDPKSCSSGCGDP